MSDRETPIADAETWRKAYSDECKAHEETRRQKKLIEDTLLSVDAKYLEMRRQLAEALAEIERTYAD